MAAHSPGPVRACVFDAYGTLFDFASAARRCRDVLGDSFDKLTALWREKRLQYTWLRSARLSARRRPAGHSRLANFLSVLKRLGCLCSVIFWNEGRLVQSVSPAQRASAGSTRPRNRNTFGTAKDRRSVLKHANSGDRY